MANYFDQFEELKDDNKQKSYWEQFEPIEAEKQADEFDMDFQDPNKVTLGDRLNAVKDNLSKAIATTGQATMSNRPYVPNTSGALEGGVNYINDLATQAGQNVQNAYNTIANKPINLMPSRLMQPVSNAFSGVGRVASDVLPFAMGGYYNSPKDIVEATQKAYNYGVEEAKRDRQQQEMNPINLAESLVDMYTIGKFMPGNKATMLGRMGVAGKTGAVYGGLESLKHKGINPKENLKDAAVDAALFATLEPLTEIGFAAAKEGAKRLNPANYQRIIESVPKKTGTGLSQRTVYEPKVKYEYKPNVKNEYGMKEALNKPRIEANKMSDSTAFELGEASEMKYGVTRPVKEAPKKTVVDYLAPNIAAKQQAKALEKAEKTEEARNSVIENLAPNTANKEVVDVDAKIAELERKMKLIGGEKTLLGQKYKRQIEELKATEQAVTPVAEEVKPVAEEPVENIPSKTEEAPKAIESEEVVAPKTETVEPAEEIQIAETSEATKPAETQEVAVETQEVAKKPAKKNSIKYSVKFDKYGNKKGFYGYSETYHTDGNAMYKFDDVDADVKRVDVNGAVTVPEKNMEAVWSKAEQNVNKLEDLGKYYVDREKRKVRLFQMGNYENGEPKYVSIDSKYLLNQKGLEVFAESPLSSMSIRKDGKQIGVVMPITMKSIDNVELIDVPKMIEEAKPVAKVKKATEVTEKTPKKTEVVNASYSLDIPENSKDITKTKEFKNWFGDSKVVDENGKPLVVYHGTADIIEVFDERYGGETTANNEYGAFFFTDNLEVAEDYSRQAYIRRYEGRDREKLEDYYKEQFNLTDEEIDNILDDLEEAAENQIKTVDTYLKIENPLIINNNYNVSPIQDIQELIGWAKEGRYSDVVEKYVDIYDTQKYAESDIEDYRKEIETRARENYDLEEGDTIEEYMFNDATREIMDENGIYPEMQEFDGIIIRNTIDDIGERSQGIQDTYIVFKPEQIKSVNNRGTFNPEDPNIYKFLDVPNFMKDVMANGYKDIDIQPINDVIAKGCTQEELLKVLPSSLHKGFDNINGYKFYNLKANKNSSTKGIQYGGNVKRIGINLDKVGNNPQKLIDTIMHEVEHADQEAYYNYLKSQQAKGIHLTQDEIAYMREYRKSDKLNHVIQQYLRKNKKAINNVVNPFLKKYQHLTREELLNKIKSIQSSIKRDMICKHLKYIDKYRDLFREVGARKQAAKYAEEFIDEERNVRRRVAKSNRFIFGTSTNRNIGAKVRSGLERGNLSIEEPTKGQKAKQSVEQTVRDKVYDWHGGIGKDRYDVDKTLNSFIRMSKNIAKDLSQKTGLKVSDKQLREMLPFLRERTNIPEKLDRDDLKKIFNALSGEEKARLVKFADETSNKFEKYYKNYLDAKGEVDEATIENHISHIWDLDDKKQALLTNYITTKSRFAKQRTIETLAKGINGIEIDGKIVEFKPKTLDYAEILKSSSDNLIKATYDMQLAETIKGMKDAEGNPLVLPAHKAPADWIEVSHPALNKAVYMGTVGEDELPMLMKSSVKVHPDLEKYVASIFETPKTSSKFWKAYDSINGMIKQSQLGFSGFHGYALSESAIANMGVKKTLESLNVKKIYDAVKNGNYEIYEHEAEAKRAIDAGVQLGTPSDLNRNLVEETLNKWPKIGKYLSGAVSVNNKILWDVLHNNFKLFTFNTKIAELEKAGKVTKEQERAVAQWVNDTYGGQSWELLGIKNSDVRKAGRVLLSPDWNFSTVRQALGSINNTKLDKIFNDTKAWKRVAELMGVSENIGGEGVRGKIARDFWIRAVVYSTVFYNAMNAAFRADDREKHPERYPKNMKPFDYSIWANANPMDNWYEKMMPYVFIGRNSDGTARMLRVGKQFREVPELASDPITKLSGKSASIIGLVSQVAVGMSPADIVKKVTGREAYLNQKIWDGYGEDARMRDGAEFLTGRISVALEGAAPFAVSKFFDKKHERSAWDMFAQTSVGSTKGKVYKEAKEAFEAGREDKIKEIKQKAYRDGVRKEDINKMVGYAEKNYKADNTKKYRKKFVEAMKNKDKKELNRIKSDMQRHHLSAKEQRRIYESAYKKYLKER